mgnify:CR=1 FL=1
MEISYTIFDLLFYLLLYAFLGWCVEVFCAAVKSGRFVNRGFLNLPLNMPCGIAAALLLPVLGTMNHKTILQYVMTLVIYILVRCVTDQFVRGVSRRRFAAEPKGKAFFLNAAIAAAVMLLVYLVVHPGMMGLLYLMPKWLERTLDDSANKRVSVAEAFLATDGILDLYINVTSGLVVYPKVIHARLMSELPFMATENIMMDAVEKGGNRQELHERIREYSMVAGARVKKEGLDNNLCELILNDPMFMITKEEMDKIMKPENFIGRCPQQVDEFIENCVKPVVEANGVSDDVAEINV